mgnify:CR=1 FL=1
MNCMKCGREISEDSVFCADCLAVMEKYPVKPSITVQIPVRPVSPPIKKKQRKQKYIKPEDQIRHLRSQIRWVSLALVAALLAFAVTAALLIRLLDQRDNEYGIGQNYGTMSSAEST